MLMSWENVIIGYKLKDFSKEDIIPVDALFISAGTSSTRICGTTYSNVYYTYQIPIYKKKNVKKK